MTPHALTPPDSNGTSSPEPRSPCYSTTDSSLPAQSSASPLPATSPADLHDLICIGFGPASLAIAVALHDHAEAHLESEPPRVAFLEKQETFAWHSGMQLPGATMQISWIKDLATLRNPRSHFTFLNYLQQVGRLLSFSNLGTFLPKRVEYEAYMRWAADHFSHLTSYSQEGLEVLPQRSKEDLEHVSRPSVDHWLIRSRNLLTGEIEQRWTRNVVLALGGRALIPSYLPQSHPRVIHSSTYMSRASSVLPDKQASYTVLVIGSGQSSAEIFHDLYNRYPNARIRLLIRGSALKPSDDSPFVNETFNPEHVDDVYATEQKLRQANLLDEKATNYGVVRLELLERIYSDMYEESVRHPERSGDDLHARILPFREVTGVETFGKSGKIRVCVQNRERLYRKAEDARDDANEILADTLVVAAGYERNAHEQLLKGATYLRSGDSESGDGWSVNRDYSVKFKQGAVAKGSGVWLQGCNESTHGLSDTLLSILSVRGGEIVDSIFGA